MQENYSQTQSDKKVYIQIFLLPEKKNEVMSLQGKTHGIFTECSNIDYLPSQTYLIRLRSGCQESQSTLQGSTLPEKTQCSLH